MSFAITLISINTGFRIRGTLVASMSARERFTIVRGGRLRNACSGCQWHESVGGSTGLGQIVADDLAWMEHYFC